MKRSAILLPFVLALVPAVFAGENLFKNSGVDTPTVWQGDRKFEKEGENKVIKLEAKKKEIVEFTQQATMDDATDLVLVFRYKAADYKGRGLQLRGRRDDGSSTFRNIEPKVSGAWVEYRWKFSEIRGAKKITFSIALLEGEGSVLFDDISLEKQG